MCQREVCWFCKRVHLGLTMAWKDASGERAGFVCYGCEDTLCQLMQAGRTDVRWLETLSGCE